MKAIDLGVEFGAKVFVLWGGREGVETDASKNPVDAIKRNREVMNFLCEYALDKKYDLEFALEAKPNEPRGISTTQPPVTCWLSSLHSTILIWWVSILKLLMNTCRASTSCTVWLRPGKRASFSILT